MHICIDIFSVKLKQANLRLIQFVVYGRIGTIFLYSYCVTRAAYKFKKKIIMSVIRLE